MLKKGGRKMATTLDKIRIKILESDCDVINAICNTLNFLANPDDQNGFKFDIKDECLTISVYRCRNSFSSFEVTLKTASLDEKVLAMNALFRKCVPKFEYDNNELVISLDPFYHMPNIPKHKDCALKEKTSTIIALRKPFPMLTSIANLFNLVKIKKVLTINQHLLSISAIGHNIALNAKFHVLRPNGNMNLPAFCSKFNYLSALGLADFDFKVLKLEQAAELFQITVFVPEDKERRKKYNETIDLLNSISSFNE